MSALPTMESLREALAAAGVAYAEPAAIQLLDDIMRFGMSEFRLGRRFPTPLGTVVEYTFGKTAYSIDNADPKRAPQFRPSDHGGTQLNSENILVFLRASELARELVPTIWLQPSDDLQGKIRSASQHLDTLNEFWWLSRWNGSFEATPNFKMHADSDLDVDWRLIWDFGLNTFVWVNLEVKRRIDVLRTGGDPSNPKELFEAGVIKDGRSKFRPSQPDEINVLGITLMGEIDHEVQQLAESWLHARNDVDAIILFSRLDSRRVHVTGGFETQIVAGMMVRTKEQEIVGTIAGAVRNRVNVRKFVVFGMPADCTSLVRFGFDIVGDCVSHPRPFFLICDRPRLIQIVLISQKGVMVPT